MRCFSLATAFSHGDFRFRLRQAGYSLYDLMVTSAVAGVLGVGAVGMNDMVQDARMTAAVNRIMGDLILARSEAVKRRSVVALCKSRDGASCTDSATWNEGWIVFSNVNSSNRQVDSDEQIIRVEQALAGNLSLQKTGDYNYIHYNPTGQVWPATTFTFCDGRGSTKAKAVIISTTGRPRISAKTAGNDPLHCP